MLKTFTILATVPASYTASSVERAMLDGLQAFGVEEDAARVDAFEGSHIDVEGMRGDIGEAANDAVAIHQQMCESTKRPRTWADLTRDQQSAVLTRAAEYGGGFVSRLADAWMRADSANAAKLGEAFGAMLLESYGDSFKG